MIVTKAEPTRGKKIRAMIVTKEESTGDEEIRSMIVKKTETTGDEKIKAMIVTKEENTRVATTMITIGTMIETTDVDTNVTTIVIMKEIGDMTKNMLVITTESTDGITIDHVMTKWEEKSSVRAIESTTIAIESMITVTKGPIVEIARMRFEKNIVAAMKGSSHRGATQDDSIPLANDDTRIPPHRRFIQLW